MLYLLYTCTSYLDLESHVSLTQNVTNIYISERRCWLDIRRINTAYGIHISCLKINATMMRLYIELIPLDQCQELNGC